MAAISITGVAPPVDVILSVVPLTEVTVPAGLATHDVTPLPSVCNMLVLDPFVAGSWKMVAVPAAAATFTVTSPDVAPNILSCPAVPLFVPDSSTPETSRLVPAATPMLGVTNVGDVSTTNFVPVPV